jgi:hypothetical protein
MCRFYLFELCLKVALFMTISKLLGVILRVICRFWWLSIHITLIIRVLLCVFSITSIHLKSHFNYVPEYILDVRGQAFAWEKNIFKESDTIPQNTLHIQSFRESNYEKIFSAIIQHELSKASSKPLFSHSCMTHVVRFISHCTYLGNSETSCANERHFYAIPEGRRCPVL